MRSVIGNVCSSLPVYLRITIFQFGVGSLLTLFGNVTVQDSWFYIGADDDLSKLHLFRRAQHTLI
jgi:hypothetical protein